MSTYEIPRTEHPYALTRLVCEEDGSVTLQAFARHDTQWVTLPAAHWQAVLALLPQVLQEAATQGRAGEPPNPFFTLDDAALDVPRAACCTHPIAHHTQTPQSGQPTAVRSAGLSLYGFWWSGGRRRRHEAPYAPPPVSRQHPPVVASHPPGLWVRHPGRAVAASEGAPAPP